MTTKFLLIFFALFGFALSEVIPFAQCGGYGVCEINELRITPCTNRTHCTLTKKTTVAVSFDFTPSFSADSIMTGLLWYNNDLGRSHSELPNADGCLLTSCPLEAGKKQTLNYNLYISNQLPNAVYTFKWKIWTRSDKECCFDTEIELTR